MLIGGIPMCGHCGTCPLLFWALSSPLPAKCAMCFVCSRTLSVPVFKQSLPDQQQGESEAAPQHSSVNKDVSQDGSTASSLFPAAPSDAERCLSGSMLASLAWFCIDGMSLMQYLHTTHSFVKTSFCALATSSRRSSKCSLNHLRMHVQLEALQLIIPIASNQAMTCGTGFHKGGRMPCFRASLQRYKHLGLQTRCCISHFAQLTCQHWLAPNVAPCATRMHIRNGGQSGCRLLHHLGLRTPPLRVMRSAGSAAQGLASSLLAIESDLDGLPRGMFDWWQVIQMPADMMPSCTAACLPPNGLLPAAQPCSPGIIGLLR